MSLDPIKNKYYCLLQQYLDQQDQACLTAAAELGTELASARLSLQEVTEFHQQTVKRLAIEFPETKFRKSAHLLSAPLLELLKSYGLGKSSDHMMSKVLDSAFDAISGMFFLLDADGTIKDYRAREEDELYVQPEVFLNKRMQDLLPTELAVQFVEKLAMLKAEGTVIDYQYSLSVPKGRRHYEGHLRKLPDCEQIVLVVQDITQRKFTEELYQVYFAKNVLSVYWVELRQPIDIKLPIAEQVALISSEGYIKDVSESCAKVYGLSRSELIGQAVTNIMDTSNLDSDHEVRKFHEEFVREGYVNNREVGPLVTANGKTKWFINSMQGVVENGFLLRYWGSQIDITEGKQAESERQRLLLAVEQAAESFMITDAEGTIEYVNPAFQAMTGYSRDELLGQNPRILSSGTHDQAFYQTMWATLLAGKSWTGRFVNKKKDGSLYTEDQMISPVLDAAGKITNYVTARRDVTQELLLEKQYQQAQKMDSVGQLAGGVAHDFNNMLGVILGYTELAKQQLSTDDALNPLLDEIQKAAQRSVDITRQLLAYARKQTVAPQSLDLNSTVPSMLNMLQRLIGEDVQLSWRPGAELWPVLIDPSQVDQLLANLCINARDAIDGVGEINIKTANVVLDDNFCAAVAELTSGSYVKLIVSDNGKGMDGETLSNVFEPFFTTKEMGLGTGLGLATVYGIVKQNKGFIFADSTVDEGSVFTIYLPKDTSQASTSLPEEQLATPTGSGETILVVEDELALLDLSRNMLECLGYKVLAANSPGQALTLFDMYASDIDLILSDVVMPEMHGKALVDKLQLIAPDLKALYMSGYPADVVASKGILDKDVHFFIQKPFKQQDLAIKVNEALSVPG